MTLEEQLTVLLKGLNIHSGQRVQVRNKLTVEALAPHCQLDNLRKKIRIGGLLVTETELYSALVIPTGGLLSERQFLRFLNVELEKEKRCAPNGTHRQLTF